MEPGQDVGADEELVEIAKGAQDSPLVRELARIAMRACFVKRGQPDWAPSPRTAASVLPRCAP